VPEVVMADSIARSMGRLAILVGGRKVVTESFPIR
jgi:hypothetical protein